MNKRNSEPAKPLSNILHEKMRKGMVTKIQLFCIEEHPNDNYLNIEMSQDNVDGKPTRNNSLFVY